MNNSNMTMIKTTLDELIDIFANAGELKWLNAMNKFRRRVETLELNEIRSVLSEILNLYGGMGSFNDLVLYKDGKLLQQDTIRLDNLRRNLFDAALKELH